MTAELINRHTEDNAIQWTNGTGTAAAAFAVVETPIAFGISPNAIPDGAEGTVWLGGVWKLTKATATAIAQGDKLGWDAVNGRVLVNPGFGVPLLGTADAAAGSSATTVNVRLALSKAPGALDGRLFSVRRAVTSAEATANAATISAAETGGDGDVTVLSAYIEATNGSLNASGAGWSNPGDGTLTVAATSIASTDTVVAIGLVSSAQ